MTCSSSASARLSVTCADSGTGFVGTARISSSSRAHTAGSRRATVCTGVCAFSRCRASGTVVVSMVLSDAQALDVAETPIAHRARIAYFGRAPVQRDRLRVVLRHAFAIVVALAKAVCGRCVADLGERLQLLHRCMRHRCGRAGGLYPRRLCQPNLTRYEPTALSSPPHSSSTLTCELQQLRLRSRLRLPSQAATVHKYRRCPVVLTVPPRPALYSLGPGACQSLHARRPTPLLLFLAFALEVAAREMMMFANGPSTCLPVFKKARVAQIVVIIRPHKSKLHY